MYIYKAISFILVCFISEKRNYIPFLPKHFRLHHYNVLSCLLIFNDFKIIPFC